MKWNTEFDTLGYPSVRMIEMDKVVTKREVLNALGLITPVTVKVKLFKQQLWKLKLEQDDVLPEDLKKKWREITIYVYDATHLNFPRTLLKSNKLEDTYLHIFTTASKSADGASAYLVIGNSQLYNS